MDENNQPQNPNGIAGKPLAPQLDANGNVFESLQATNVPRPEMPKVDSADVITNLHKEEELPHLRTYESDIADAIRQDKASLVNIAIKQNQKAQEKKAPENQGKKPDVVIISDQPAPSRPSNVPYILLILVLIIGGVGALGGLGYYLYMKSASIPAPIDAGGGKIISSESIATIVLNKGDSIQDIIASRIAAVPPESTAKIGRYVFMEQVATENPDRSAPATTTQPLQPDAFADRLNTQMPSWLARSVSAYAVGYYKGDSVQPFLIFKVNSFENGFAGMLKWESTMEQDLAKILPPTTIATTSTSTPAWKDRIIQNKNARVLYSGGEPLLFYSLVDKETILITASESSLKELIARLTISQFSR